MVVEFVAPPSLRREWNRERWEAAPDTEAESIRCRYERRPSVSCAMPLKGSVLDVFTSRICPVVVSRLAK
jgi:hypothetical protein